MQSNIEAYNYNLINDLSDFLNGYLSQFDFNYYLKDVQLSLDEVLCTKKFGLLYLFLFSQKRFIKNYVENLNKTNNSTFYTS